MDGVKGVEGELPRPAAPALLPVVQPDGNERQHREALQGEFQPKPRQRQGQGHALKGKQVDEHQRRQPPHLRHGEAPEHMEHHHREHPQRSVVHEAQQGQHQMIL